MTKNATGHTSILHFWDSVDEAPLSSAAGNVFETRALDELLPDWREKGAPIETEVTQDAFHFLTESSSVQIPNMILPPQLVRRGLICVKLLHSTSNSFRRLLSGFILRASRFLSDIVVLSHIYPNSIMKEIT